MSASIISVLISEDLDEDSAGYVNNILENTLDEEIDEIHDTIYSYLLEVLSDESRALLVTLKVLDIYQGKRNGKLEPEVPVSNDQPSASLSERLAEIQRKVDYKNETSKTNIRSNLEDIKIRNDIVQQYGYYLSENEDFGESEKVDKPQVRRDTDGNPLIFGSKKKNGKPSPEVIEVIDEVPKESNRGAKKKLKEFEKEVEALTKTLIKQKAAKAAASGKTENPKHKR